MPGIIRDPKQNKTKEGRYGIIQFKGQLAIYDKKKNPALRFLPAGWQCDMSEAEIIDLKETFWWDGTLPIKYEVIGIKVIIDETLEDQGLVIKELFRKEGGIKGREQTMRDAKVKFYDE